MNDEKKLKILVVDDDRVDRMAVSRALKKAGVKMKLSEATDVASAITSLQDNSFDCVFVDYRLPDKNGLDLVKELNKIGIKVPLIVLTGQGDERIAVELMKAGAYDYLSKSSITPESLQRSLRNAIRVHRAEIKAELAHHRLRASNELLKDKNKELERQREKINLQNLELQKAYQLKSQFLATMSHELRTPMNAIMGFSQLLLGQYPDPLTEQQIDLVQRIFNNSQNLLNMLNEVLDFSKIEAGKLQFKKEEFNLAELVTFTTEELRSLAVQKNIGLQVEIDLKDTQVVNDSSCLRRILVNLISNAIKFTESGGVWVKAYSHSQECLAIAVKDTGIGIPPDKLDTIFDAFRQVDARLTRQYAGTGLGLAITDSLVKMMQGKITVESQVGEGSVFRVDLPRNVEQQHSWDVMVNYS